MCFSSLVLSWRTKILKRVRRVVYYLLYKMDPKKTHYKISFSTKISKIQNSGFFLYIFPPHSRCQQLLLGPPVPRAPGARMTAVTETPSNYSTIPLLTMVSVYYYSFIDSSIL